MKLIIAAVLAFGLCSCASLSLHPQHVLQTTLKAPQKSSELLSLDHPPKVVMHEEVAQTSPQVPYTRRDVGCMAEALYFEARGEGDKGMEAVGYVIMNRIHSDAFPNTACGVVHQAVWRHGHMLVDHCQFGWYCARVKPHIHNWKVYDHCMDLAKLVLIGFAPNPIGHCLYFHGDSVRLRHVRVALRMRVGHQVFYTLVASS